MTWTLQIVQQKKSISISYFLPHILCASLEKNLFFSFFFFGHARVDYCKTITPNKWQLDLAFPPTLGYHIAVLHDSYTTATGVENNNNQQFHLQAKQSSVNKISTFGISLATFPSLSISVTTSNLVSPKNCNPDRGPVRKQKILVWTNNLIWI